MLHSHVVVTALVCIGNQRCPLVRGSCVCVRFACVWMCERVFSFHVVVPDANRNNLREFRISMKINYYYYSIFSLYLMSMELSVGGRKVFIQKNIFGRCMGKDENSQTISLTTCSILRFNLFTCHNISHFRSLSLRLSTANSNKRNSTCSIADAN